MFSKSKINEPIDARADDKRPEPKGPAAAAPLAAPATGGSGGKSKTTPSLISSDLTITGNIETTGDVQIEGKIDGDIHAHLLTVGQSAEITGEVVADDIVVHGHVAGCVRGLKVRLTSSAEVKGDIIHKTIAIESGAHFEGSVQRSDDPLKSESKTKKGSGEPASPKALPSQ